jgi:FkbM family methyltransferase
MKKFLKSVPLLGPVLTHVHNWNNDLARRLASILRDRQNLSVVQIGSNDGITGDPLHFLIRSNRSWKALLVEPVPFLFERLCQNYSALPNIKFANVAIADQAGMATFYYVDSLAKTYIPNLPCLFDQVGSFDPSHIARHFGDMLDNFIVRAKISTLPLSTLLERNDVTEIHLLHIDTEGYDWVVLRQLDLRRFRPEVILFEHKHLSDDDKKKALAFLKNDYRITKFRYDFLCQRKKD